MDNLLSDKSERLEYHFFSRIYIIFTNKEHKYAMKPINRVRIHEFCDRSVGIGSSGMSETHFLRFLKRGWESYPISFHGWIAVIFVQLSRRDTLRKPSCVQALYQITEICWYTIPFVDWDTNARLVRSDS